ncbi:unnamed protein product [Durusdinium trenchii]|uniref:Ion transport domain-containing protein n=1 Tax=Durusdinium trenchii TaxID=1381693 RepID=A0ABP0PXM3_9DINO
MYQTLRLTSCQEHCQGKKSVLRVVRRTRLDYIWETLDDPNSSKTAWWLSQAWAVTSGLHFLTPLLFVYSCQLWSTTQVAVVETCFDSVFCLEFILRIISAPSKFMYFTDPVNIADIVCVLGLPLRASIGFVYTSDPETLWVKGVQIMLIFFLPLFRFLKLLRYFETTRLLIDACAKSAEAVPAALRQWVLSYMMALIVLVSATFIYFFEDRNNIPSMPHALWLAVVTMTTVGYGDYFPKSLGGLPDRRCADLHQRGLFGIARGHCGL